MSHDADLAAVKRLDALYLRAQQTGKSRDWWRYNRAARDVQQRLNVTADIPRPQPRRRAA